MTLHRSMGWLICFFALGLSPWAKAVTQDLILPNEFAGAPPLPGALKDLAPGEAPDEYVVQEGDSLYDICAQLIDEGNYWPKLWSLNPEIKNPHFIFPGMKLRFFTGDAEKPPFLEVVSEDDIVPVDKAQLELKELLTQQQEAGRATTELAEESAAEVEQAIEVVGPDGVDTSEIGDLIESVGQQYTGDQISVLLPGFIFSDERNALGVVVEGEQGENLVGEGQKIKVEPDSGDLATGSVFTVLRFGKKVKDPLTGDFIGYLYHFVSQVRIDRVDQSTGEAIGTVFQGRLGAMAGDIVTSYVSTRRAISSPTARGSGAPASSFVVSGEYPQQIIAGEGELVFIARASSISNGQFVNVYQANKLSLKNEGPTSFDGLSESALLRVIDVTEAGAVAYVVHANRGVVAGDRLSNQ